MKHFYSAVSGIVSLLILSAGISTAQSITVSQETFPNQFNAGFGNPATNVSNGNFTGSIGTWTSTANTTAALAVIPPYYSPVTNAIKIVNWNTSGVAAGDCRAVAPSVNLSNYNCSPAMNLTFKLYTHSCAAADINTTLQVDFSTDNGTTWTAAYSITSAAMFNTWGLDNIATITIPITAPYRVAGFKYRFSGHKPANQPDNFYIFIDDITILANPCTTSFKLGNLVWYDINNDGIRQSTETGVSGVMVNIYNDANNDNIADGTPINSTVTDANGWYNFTNLGAGNYIVGVNLPGAYIKCAVNGGDPDNNTDNDNNGINVAGGELRGNAITLAANSEKDSLGNINTNYNATYDIGITGTGSIGDYLWKDENKNGLQDVGETGLTGQSILLKNAAGTITLAAATTDANGKYRFDNLIPGSYSIKFPGINAMTPAPTLVGSNLAINSKPDHTTMSYAVTLALNETNFNVDGGYQSATILPITLGDFNAIYANGFAQLKWNTVAENNTSYFDVERSTNGTAFTVIGKVNASGNSNTNTEYSFSDLTVQKGIDFYRLKMVDIDGNIIYSKVLAMNTDAKGISLLLVYPNPFGQKVQVKIQSEIIEEISIRVLNNSGGIVRAQNEYIQPGDNIIVVNNVADLPGGIYYLEIITFEKTFRTRIMKQ